MSIKLLLQEFDGLLDAPNAIPRMRRFILDLAVRGKLVEPQATDESAIQLIERIRKGTREPPLAARYRSIVDAPIDDPPFGVPESWVWSRLGLVAEYIQRGKSPKYATGDGPPVVSQKCVRWEGLDLGPVKAITPESLLAYEEWRFLRNEDLLWNSTGTGTIGRVSRVVDPPDQLVCDSHVTIVRCPAVNSEYVRCWLRSDHVFGKIEGEASGSTNQVELTLQMALGQPVPLPPLLEQDRIVAKVQDLISVCDELDATRVCALAERSLLLETLLDGALHDDG